MTWTTTNFSSSSTSISRDEIRKAECVRSFVRTLPLVILVTAMGALGYRSTTGAAENQDSSSTSPTPIDTVRFSEHVFPIFQKNCLPCHAEENFNPSELSLDSYELLMAGGRHGDAVLPGNGAESPLVQKLRPNPPFGDPMPLDMRKKRGRKPTVKPLSEEEIQLIATWIDQGARDN